MRYYGYNGVSYKYKISDDGVVVDLERRVLRLTATYDGYGKEPIVEEFPLLTLRSCAKCGASISIYAVGSLNSIRTRTQEKLFSAPWEYGTWRTLEFNGGFALVASEGHNHRRGSHGYSEATCHESSLKLTHQVTL